MSAHIAIVQWERGEYPFIGHRYSRSHRWRFDGGLEIPASSAPGVVRPPFSDPAAVDPEEAFVASLSSCHMLWFLDLAARAGFLVERYTDHAEGLLTRREDGRWWLSRVVLTPSVVFSGTQVPEEESVRSLHHRAHAECFLANAVKTEIEIRGEWQHREIAAPPA